MLWEKRLHVGNANFFKIKTLVSYLQANTWCARGIELLASQHIEKCSASADYAEESLQELQRFVLSASEFCTTSSPNELRNVFQESATPETKALVTQVMWEALWGRCLMCCILFLFLFLFIICTGFNTHIHSS